jgi:DNA-binding MarR family transcriptional regulator
MARKVGKPLSRVGSTPRVRLRRGDRGNQERDVGSLQVGDLFMAGKAAIVAPRGEASEVVIRRLAWFRYQLRQFLRFSEKAARAAGITPQQHQLLLGVAGFTGRGWATVSELAEFLQERHNAVVGLVERAARQGWVAKEGVAHDRRLVRVELTTQGKRILTGLSALHRKELARFQARLANLPEGHGVAQIKPESDSEKVM